jgi:hypothetical protein
MNNICIPPTAFYTLLYSAVIMAGIILGMVGSALYRNR